MKVLITGGAGYIGSHVALEALQEGFDVTVFDDLSTGSTNNLHRKIDFVFGSTTSKKDLNNLFIRKSYDFVIHLAASKAVSESMKNPIQYSDNNIIGGLNLIRFCLEFKVKCFIFSSTAAVYGKPKQVPISELHSLNPLNYYGYTKLSIEKNLEWISKLTKLNYISLRYFNAAGYDIKNRIKGVEKNPQNLIPRVMEVALGLKDQIHVFGDDFETKDGTGVRDYIHVSDLAKAHIKAIYYLKKQKENLVVNLGTGEGHSVLDVIKATQKISQKRIEYVIEGRREGDAANVIASGRLAKEKLNWHPIESDLSTIISSTWDIYKVSQIFHPTK